MNTGGVKLKSHHDLKLIYRACQVAAKLLNELKSRVRPGVSTAELNAFAEKFIAGHGCVPAFKGYRKFPSALCTSVNDEVVHGIPSSRRILTEGDVLSVDTGAVWKGFFSDTAYTYYVGDGEIPAETRKLLEATSEALASAVAAAKAGAKLNRVSEAVAQRAHRDGYKVIRDLTGHGIGFSLHEPPTIHNYPVPEGDAIRLRNGMVLAIEPMLSVGTEEIVLGDDGWTYRTADGSVAAHFEHTVAIWDGVPVVLTEEGSETARTLFGDD